MEPPNEVQTSRLYNHASRPARATHPRLSAQRRGKIARHAFANPERLESSQRGMRRSLSLRERVRVRGNETQPTETAGRILQAQPNRLPESDLATTSSAEPVASGSGRPRNLRQVQ